MFQNENTFSEMKSEGREEEFHKRYEESVIAAKEEFGKTYPMIIGGIEIRSSDGVFADTSPSDTKLVLGYFQKGSREDARRAIETAQKAFEWWSHVNYAERVALFRKSADLMSKRKFALAAEISFENGKNRFEAIADVDEAIDFLRFYSEQLEENKGFERPMGSLLPGEHARSLLRPYGVWSVIAPFNFPLAIATGMTSGALITGNTVVLKPASDTPLMSYELYKILESADLPAGVLNYITGPGTTVGAELIENTNISGVVFTGSWDVGSKSIVDFEEKSPRPFIAEMGGKNATIVTARADLTKATEGVLRGAFGFGGQKCSACSRVYVQDSIRDEFVRKLSEKVSQLKVGEPTQRDVFLGPLINEKAYKNYQRFTDEARSRGKILVGGEVLNDEPFTQGYYVKPTIVLDLPENDKLVKTELFVPILVVEPFDKLEDAIEKMNDVDYGLTGGIFSKDKGEVDLFFSKAQAGVLYANRMGGSTTGAIVGVQSFVGWKHSGSSGKGAGGPYYLQQFLREQSQTFYD
ncbi:MAG: aldehyde dehydrogenase family protein [archaeon]|nr:aldehyde dehydrogenase family protein [archaeon]